MKRILAIFVVIILSILLSISTNVLAVGEDASHITLLAVSEKDGNISGETADLYLEIKQGEGRVFIDTYPLTQMDTQISTRFAKEIACDFVNRNLKRVDCKDYDFIYTIKAKAPIIGGPSAGGAIAIVTISKLSGLEIDENVAVTGTINSGGMIGVVSGIKQKIDAAAEDGKRRVLIPYGTRFFEEDDQEMDLKEYAKDRGIELIEVENLDDSIFYFTGKKTKEDNKELEINEKYMDVMKSLSDDLCQRSEVFINKLQTTIDEKAVNLLQDVNKQLESSKGAYGNKRYYSSASYCFGANVKLGSLYLRQQNLSYEDAVVYVDELRKKVDEFESEVDSKQIKTNSDLQTYMVVKERIIETKELLEKVKDANNPDYLYDLAFGEERYYSALSWKEFFGSDIGEKKMFEDKDILQKICNEKIEEAQERMYYLFITLPIYLNEVEKEIDYAIEDMKNKNYGLCLFKALKAKAQANSILSVMNVKDEFVNKTISIKLDIVKSNIITESENNIFPIMGYSYYEYADDLKDSDQGAALLYSEFALELSNFHIYLDQQVNRSNIFVKKTLDRDYGAYIVIFLTGVMIGLLYNFNLGKKGPKLSKKAK